MTPCAWIVESIMSIMKVVEIMGGWVLIVRWKEGEKKKGFSSFLLLFLPRQKPGVAKWWDFSKNNPESKRTYFWYSSSNNNEVWWKIPAISTQHGWSSTISRMLSSILLWPQFCMAYPIQFHGAGSFMWVDRRNQMHIIRVLEQQLGKWHCTALAQTPCVSLACDVDTFTFQTPKHQTTNNLNVSLMCNFFFSYESKYDTYCPLHNASCADILLKSPHNNNKVYLIE